MTDKSTGLTAHTNPELATTVEALRDSLDEEVSTTPGREIGLLGLGAGFVAVLIWAVFLQEKNNPHVIVLEKLDASALQQEWAWVATAAEQATRAYLLAGNRVRVIDPSEGVTIGRTRIPGATTQESGARWVLSGRLSQTNTRENLLTLDVALTDLNNGQTRNATLTGTAMGLSDLTLRFVQQVQLWLNLGLLDSQALAAAEAELPTDATSRKLYAQALAAIDRSNASDAIPLLERADTLNPDHPLIHIALADAWSLMGYQFKVREYAKRAFELRTRLSREKQLVIEGRYRESHEEWHRAQDVYRALWEFYPTDINYGLALANALAQSDARVEALQTLDQLNALPVPFSDDPRIELTQAIIHWQLGDWQSGLPIIRGVVDKARATDNKDLLATALRWEFDLSDTGKDEKLLDEAEDLFASTGNLRGTTDVLHSRGVNARGRGDLQAAERYFTDARTIAESLSLEANATRAMSGLAIVMDLYGRLGEGLALKQSIFDSYERRSIKAGAAVTRENIGHSYYKLGRLADAQEEFRAAGEAFVRVGDEIGLAWRPYHQARILLGFGELREAEEAIVWALENAEERPEGSLEAHSKYVLAQIQIHRGQFDEAHTNINVLLDYYSDAHLEVDLAATQILLAGLQRRRQHFRSIPQLLESAMNGLRQLGAEQYQLLAHIERLDYTRTRFAKQPLDERARRELTQSCAALRGQTTEYLSVALRARVRALTCDEMLGESRQDNDARLAELEDVLKTASRNGLLEARLDAARAIEALYSQSNSPTRPHPATATLQEAREKGWRW